MTDPTANILSLAALLAAAQNENAALKRSLLNPPPKADPLPMAQPVTVETAKTYLASMAHAGERLVEVEVTDKLTGEVSKVQRKVRQPLAVAEDQRKAVSAFVGYSYAEPLGVQIDRANATAYRTLRPVKAGDAKVSTARFAGQGIRQDGSDDQATVLAGLVAREGLIAEGMIDASKLLASGIDPTTGKAMSPALRSACNTLVEHGKAELAKVRGQQAAIASVEAPRGQADSCADLRQRAAESAKRDLAARLAQRKAEREGLVEPSKPMALAGADDNG